jgi:uncharacterized protein (TIGR03084 family)
VPADIGGLCDDLGLETAELVGLLAGLDDADWSAPTPAAGWSVRDQISHLAYFDEATTTAVTAPDAFRASRSEAGADVDAFTARIAERYRAVPADELLAWFERARAGMVAAFRAAEPSERVPWYGPDMSMGSAVTARIMETWAHGQDVADAGPAFRSPTPALRHVAHLGVRTLPNSFRTVGRAVPTDPVSVELLAPSGELWTWEAGDSANSVRGPALDFCLVVTQRRHIADTDLRVTGPVASEWMSIAQAYAGPAGSGRPPGKRRGPAPG